MDLPKNINGKVYTSWKYDEGTHFITFMDGSQYIYLLEGNEYALLIDTGYGEGGLREYVETLTSKPVLVTLTHGHLDHSGGIAEWEKVYMHKDAEMDFPAFRNESLPHLNHEKVLVGDGYVFDLGGRKVEVIEISSHSNSSLAFLDASYNSLYSGDELESMQVIMFNLNGVEGYDYPAHIRKHKENMLKLKARSNEFDYICPAHNGAPIAKSYIDDFIALDEKILEGKAIIDEKLNHVHFETNPMGEGICRVRWNKASFFSARADVEKLI